MCRTGAASVAAGSSGIHLEGVPFDLASPKTWKTIANSRFLVNVEGKIAKVEQTNFYVPTARSNTTSYYFGQDIILLEFPSFYSISMSCNFWPDFSTSREEL